MLLATTLAVPAALLGTWTASCGPEFPERLQFDAGRVSLEFAKPTTCRRTGHRSLSRSRWYMDLACEDGSIVQLDLYVVNANSLLVAQRPLGVACSYQRSR
jgi:hypothetical protein